MRLLATVALLAVVAGCQYAAPVVSAPSFEVYSNFGDKVKGHYLLFVDTGTLITTVRPAGLSCSAHTYPVDLTSAFKGSVLQTLANVVDSIEEVAAPVAADGLAARNARGMIVVRGETVDGTLHAIEGMWSSTTVTEIRIVASVLTDGRKGRLLGTTIEGAGRAEADAGFACEGGAKSLGAASQAAMKDAVRKIGEAIANSDRVRAGT